MNIKGNPWEEIQNGIYRRWINVMLMNSYIYEITKDCLTVTFQYGNDWERVKRYSYSI